MMFLLIIPITVGISIASYSIVGEKVNRNLEPLLATPITTTELLWAKSLAAAIPVVIIAWLAFAIYAAFIFSFTSAAVVSHVLNVKTTCIIFLPPIGLMLAQIRGIFFLTPVIIFVAAVVLASLSRSPRSLAEWRIHEPAAVTTTSRRSDLFSINLADLE